MPPESLLNKVILGERGTQFYLGFEDYSRLKIVKYGRKLTTDGPSIFPKNAFSCAP